MKKKVFFLLNNLSEFSFADYIDKYLSNYDVVVETSLPNKTEDYDLIVFWSYRKIVPNIGNKNNIILFHSSDLPDGKGWAPIYNTIIKEHEYFTISGIKAAEEVDSGDIIVKARFRMKPNYTAEYIRRWDEEISVMLVEKILERFDRKQIVGIPQAGTGSFHERRKPEHNEINTENFVNHLRACEKKHPAFFYYKGQKFFVTIEPENIPEFPDDLVISFVK
tara:strand:+ start:215 stop:877 length:663 start_codon:yes stop_codon:yes gene_type:complete